MDDYISKFSTLHCDDNDISIMQAMVQRVIKNDIALELYNQRKCAKIAMEKIMEGNRLFASSQSSTKELLKIYSAAIAYAPNHSTELAKAYGNRSAVLCNARLYEDSLIDINRALELDYPDNLIAKLYVRKVRNLLGLNPEIRLEIEEAMTAARFWMIKLNDADKKFVESNLNKLSQRKSFPEPFKKPDCKYIMSEITDANNKLPGASTAIELKYSDKFGRHFIATRDINVGETLIKQQAYVSTIESNFFYSHCWHCSKRAWASIPCEHCVNVIFCNEQCRDAAWNKYHDIECAFITAMSLQRLNEIEIAAMRLTIKALKEAGSAEVLKKKLAMIDLIQDPIIQAFTGDIIDSTTYTGIYTLSWCTPTAKEISNMLLKCGLMLVVLTTVSEIIGKKIDNIEELATDEIAAFIGEFAYANLVIRMTNGFEAIIFDDGEYVERGAVISCLTSYLNHSCDPNAFIVNFGDIVAVNCTTKIKKDEQIFVSYGRYYQKSPRSVRREFFKKNYEFVCTCRACLENWGPQSTWPSFKDQFLPFEVKKKLKKEINKFYKHFNRQSEYVIEQMLRTDPSYIPLLSELLNVLHQGVRYPSEEICKHKFFLQYNYMHNSV